MNNTNETMKSKRNSPLNWLFVDWNLHDAAIAKKYRVSRVAVGKARARLGKLPSPKRRFVKLPQKYRLLKAMEICSKLVAWDRIGVWDYIPKWCAEEFNKMVDDARVLLEKRSEDLESFFEMTYDTRK